MLENSGNEPELFCSIRRRKLTHSGHALRYEGDRLEKDVMIDAQQQVQENPEEDGLKNDTEERAERTTNRAHYRDLTRLACDPSTLLQRMTA